MTTTYTNPFTEAEFAWLWPKYRACGFPVASFPKRFARNELSQLTEKGRNTGASLAFQYRRQIFGQRSAKWTFDEFTKAVQFAAKQPTK